MVDSKNDYKKTNSIIEINNYTLNNEKLQKYKNNSQEVFEFVDRFFSTVKKK